MTLPRDEDNQAHDTGEVRLLTADGSFMATGILEIDKDIELTGLDTIWTGQFHSSIDLSLLLVPVDAEPPVNDYVLQFSNGKKTRVQIPSHDVEDRTLIIRGLEPLS